MHPSRPPRTGLPAFPASPAPARPRLARLAFGLLACVLAPLAQARDTADDARLRAAIEDAERGRFDAAAHAGVRGHPAFGWVEYAALARELDTLAPQRGLDFLARYRGQAVADAFRRNWLASLARRGDWTSFRAAWDAAIDDTALRCHELQARNAAGALDEAWVQAARGIWMSAEGPLPAACDPVFAALDARGALGPALRWERLEKAAAAWEPAAMRAAAGSQNPSARSPRTTRPSSSRRTSGRWPGRRTTAAAASPPTGWRSWARTTRTAPSACCRATPPRWAWARPSAASCCTRWRCGQWLPTCPTPREG
jgi:hypothetical protein